MQESKPITKDKWVWMPHPAHLIVSSKCRFHLATKVGKFIISTVGEWWPERISREIHAKIYDPKWHEEHNHLLGDTYNAAYFKRFGFKEIGCGRKYETFVFKCQKNTVKENACCPWKVADYPEIDSDAYNEADKAYEGHLKMCNKYAKK